MARRANPDAIGVCRIIERVSLCKEISFQTEPGSVYFEHRLAGPALCRVQVDYGLIAALKDSDSAFL